MITIQDIATFCKKKGFVYPSSEIYGGLSGFFDFGPLGVELFNNIKNSWWKFFVQEKENMVGIEASVISHPKTWKASGHIENFNVNDYLVTCLKCKKSSKIDKPQLRKIKCECGGDYEWDKAKMVEQMFKTRIGTDQTEAYLRGETAQGMFLDFKSIYETCRVRLPFGIAQIGRCFRNEIAPRDFLFRSREFNIGEFEFFMHPDEKKCNLLDSEHLNIKLKLLDAETQEKGKDTLKEITLKKMLEEKRLEEWHAYWLAEQISWLKKIGLEKLKIREHTKSELSHYSSATFDIDYEYPFGSYELAGNANRGQYDLTQHMKESKEKLDVFDEKTKQRVIPRVIEPTFGMERLFLAVICNAYHYDEKRQNVVLKFPASLAPIKAAIFPLINDTKIERMARDVFAELKKEFNVSYDLGGSIGRRYSRSDEIGVPIAITIDEKSVKDNAVTLRNRDDTKQIRVKIKGLKEVLRKLINEEIKFEKAGKLVETRKK